MSVQILSEEQKDSVCLFHQNGSFQKTIAEAFGVSPRTIYRVLVERGHIIPAEKLSPKAQAVMRVVNHYGLTADQLASVLRTPALTYENVQQYLNQCSPDTLAQLFYSSALHKFGEAYLKSDGVKQAEESHAEQEA